MAANFTISKIFRDGIIIFPNKVYVLASEKQEKMIKKVLNKKPLGKFSFQIWRDDFKVEKGGEKILFLLIFTSAILHIQYEKENFGKQEKKLFRDFFKDETKYSVVLNDNIDQFYKNFIIDKLLNIYPKNDYHREIVETYERCYEFCKKNDNYLKGLNWINYIWFNYFVNSI